MHFDCTEDVSVRLITSFSKPFPFSPLKQPATNLELLQLQNNFLKAKVFINIIVNLTSKKNTFFMITSYYQITVLSLPWCHFSQLQFKAKVKG